MAKNTELQKQEAIKAVATEIHGLGIDFESGDYNLRASALTSALNTQVSNGLDKQIAYINVVDTMFQLDNQYDYVYKGTLALGIGMQNRYVGFKLSVSSDPETNNWLPSGPMQKLDKWTSTHTGSILRQVQNDYSLEEMKEFMRTTQGLTDLLQRENETTFKTINREARETPREVYGVNVSNKILPADIKTQLADIKNEIGKNVIKGGALTTMKEKVNFINEFMDTYYLDHSDEYNCGGGQADKGFIYIKGTKTNVPVKMNTARKEDTVLYISTKFKNRLRQEMGDTWHPAYWLEFTNNFGRVVIDKFANEDDVRIGDKDVFQTYDMFDTWGLEYFIFKPAFSSIAHWKKHYHYNPFLNFITIKWEA